MIEKTKNIKAILSPIIEHLNDTYNWKATIKENAELPLEYQHSLESLRLEEDEVRERLAEYVESWLPAESDFRKWQKVNPSMISKIQETLNKAEFLLLPDKAGRATFFSVTPTDSKVSYADREAAWLFVKFITSPFYDRISKCPSCRSYFFGLRGGGKKYCSRRCATGFTARQAMKAKRAEDQRQKLELAKDALNKYKALKRKEEDWKGWIAKRAKVSRNWLTRALERGDISNPSKK